MSNKPRRPFLLTTSTRAASVLIGFWLILILGEFVLLARSDGELDWLLYLIIAVIALMLLGYVVTLYNLRRNPALVRPVKKSRRPLDDPESPYREPPLPDR